MIMEVHQLELELELEDGTPQTNNCYKYNALNNTN